MHQPDIQTNPSHLRRQLLRRPQFCESAVPFLAAHGNHAQVEVCAWIIWIESQYLPEGRVGHREITARQRLLTLLEVFFDALCGRAGDCQNQEKCQDSAGHLSSLT
jgi:hypothetical protein